MTISSNKHKQQTVTNYKQHKSIVPHDSTKSPKNPRTTNTCTCYPGTHTPCTHAHTNNNPSDQAHPHTHNNDTSSCKLFELRAKFVRSSYEIRTNFVTTTFTVPICEALFVRISYEFRTNFERTSYEFHTNFVPFLRDTVGCSVLGRGAEPLVRTQFLEHPPTLNFGANHLKKWIQHPQKPPIPFLSPHNPHHGGGFWGGCQRVRAQLEQS